MLVTCAHHSEKTLLFSKEFAARYNFRFSSEIPESAPCFFSFDGSQSLFLHFRDKTTKQTHKLTVNFNRGKSAYRLAKNNSIKQPMARAVGIKPGFRPDIIDVTAGLGQDAFVLASLGCKVTLIERSPVLYALLENGLQRGLDSSTTREILSKRMDLHHADSITFLCKIAKAHTIYMDPMYPHSPNSALNKINMRIIRDLVGDDLDAQQLLDQSLKHASNRVVVKRPKRATPIESPSQPTYSITMKNSRFDVYLTSHR